MTKVVNKKFVAILMVIFFSLCMIATSASAAEASTNEDYFANGASITYLGKGDGDEAQPTSINSLLLRSLSVYAYGIVDGELSACTINNEYGYAVGPTGILNCTIPSTFYQGMIDLGFEYYYNSLVFSIDGTNLYRVVLEVDDEVVVDSSLTTSGYYTINWVSSRARSSSYRLVVYSNNVSSAVWGHINVA